MRPFPNKTGSYDAAVRGFKKLLKAGMEKIIICVVLILILIRILLKILSI